MAFLFFPIAWIVLTAGRNTLHLCGVRRSDESPLLILCSLCVGLTLLSYALLAVGVMGMMSLLGLAITLAIMLACSIGAHKSQFQQLLQLTNRAWHAGSTARVVFTIVLFFAGVGLVGVFVPPTIFIPGINYTEYDSLTYHLADPAYYIRHMRIQPMPWEDHSNFPFTAEMWYTAGLLLHSIPLAKLFHWLCCPILTASVYLFAKRISGERAGQVAAVLIASMPFVFWESGTCYVDLSYAAFAMVCLTAIAEAHFSRSKVWLLISAMVCGAMLGTKTLALANAVIFGAFLIFIVITERKSAFKFQLIDISKWTILAAAFGSPWYIRSAIFTGNPVYPFLYNVFGGKFWSKEAAERVAAENVSFGMGRSFVDFLLSPWAVTQYSLNATYVKLDSLVSFPHGLPFNYYTSLLNTISPVLLGLVLVVLVVPVGCKSTLKILATYCVLLYVVWFLTMQYGRYLFGILPVICVIAGIAVSEVLSVRGFLRSTVMSCLAVSILFSTFTAVYLVSKLLPVAVGMQSKKEFRAKYDYSQPVVSFINHNLPKSARLAFYGFPFGFYCERDYFWGEPEHGTYIPYNSLTTAHDLGKYFVDHGIEYIVVDGHNFPLNAPSGYQSLIDSITVKEQAPMFAKGRVGIWHLDPAEYR